MRRPWMILVGAALMIFLVEGSVDAGRGEEQMIDRRVMEMMSKLDSLDDRSLMELLSQVDEQRGELHAALVNQLRTSPSTRVQASAIYLMGRNRLSESVQDLIQRIDFAPETKPWVGSEPLWEKYPAMEALITIDLPSVAPSIELLATDSNDLRRSLAVKVIRYVEGPDVARFVLEKAYQKENDPSRKPKLKDALARFDELVQRTK